MTSLGVFIEFYHHYQCTLVSPFASLSCLSEILLAYQLIYEILTGCSRKSARKKFLRAIA